MEPPVQPGCSEGEEAVGVEGMYSTAVAEDRTDDIDSDLSTSTDTGQGTNYTKLEVVERGRHVYSQQVDGLLGMTKVGEDLVVSSVLPFPHPSF